MKIKDAIKTHANNKVIKLLNERDIVSIDYNANADTYVIRLGEEKKCDTDKRQ